MISFNLEVPLFVQCAFVEPRSQEAIFPDTAPYAFVVRWIGPAKDFPSVSRSCVGLIIRYVNGLQTYMCRVEVLQAQCVCRTTDGFVIAGRAVKSVSWQVSCEMKVTRVEQHADIKIAVLRGRKAMECHSELVKALGNNTLSYRTVARWTGKFQQGRVSTSDEQCSGRSVCVRTDLVRAIIEQLMDEDR
ncbi:HTH_48 domain-containing protein [Trichonephila clavipes]|nr:HTH_48 domain-containing protein [Trichonephila clavipes]